MGTAALDLRGSAGRRLAPGLAAFTFVAISYLAVATRNLDLPGVYMDAVNPDYLVVKVLNPRHQPIVAWVLDGNYLVGNRLPWMVSLYHGSETFWFGLPFYALFGTTVEGLRLTHAMFALGVLGALVFFLRRAGLGALAAAACATALAIDPAFTYAFRSQSYITLAPSAFVLTGAALLVGRDGPARPVASGALTGLAATGYFVQGFLLAALLPALALVTRGAPGGAATRRRWLGGLALGLAPVALGYALLLDDQGGVRGLVDYFARQQAALGAFASPLPLPARVDFAWTVLHGVVSNAWLHSMMFHEWVGVPGAAIKVAALLGLPVVLWLLAEVRGVASAAQRLCIAMPVAFLAMALVFGSRLGGHHYVIVLPWLYAALALGLAALGASRDTIDENGAAASPLRPGMMVALVAWVALAGLNGVGQVSEARTLVATGGVGTMSDAINRYAADLSAMPRKPFVFFPDWGLALPVAFLTRGNVAMDSVEDLAAARRELCAGRDVHVAFMHDRDTRTQAWSAALGVRPHVTPYRQRDGTVVFDDVAFRAADAAATCTAAR